VFLCCGDALFDLFVQSNMGVNSKTASQSRISLSGDVGGSPMNVATGLARLGHHSRYFAKFSTDLFGQRMRGYLKHNKIDTALSLETELNTTLAIVETNTDGSANYVFYTDNTADVSITERDIPAELPGQIRVLHFGSYSTAVDPTASALATLGAREKNNRIISYDPNLRPSIEPDISKWQETFQQYARSATLVKASDEDIETLLGKGQEERFIAECFDMGVQLVFITRGADGASGFAADGKTACCPGVSVSVVDTVGAGDTFQAAILHWLTHHGHIQQSNKLVGAVDLKASMDFAIRAAAITCTRSGADLPYLVELS